jgi:hypothetical protein
MRALLLPVLCSLAACASAPDAARAADADTLVLREWSAPCGVGVTPRCALADSAWQANELRAAVPELARADVRCDFATERLLVVVVPQAGLGLPVAHERHVEEGVDVLVLKPTSGGPSDLGVVHALVVAARPAPLAVVLRTPGAAGRALERTLAVFPPR